ncbi:MAG: hypothetical protein K2Z25_10980 [Beijerinckiaceae bacterium]|nr:hypothetical protein [Beijerinckiaceae bacterium]
MADDPAVAFLQRKQNVRFGPLGKPIPQSFHGFARLTLGLVSGPENRPFGQIDRSSKAHIFHEFSGQTICRAGIAESLGSVRRVSKKKDSRAFPQGLGEENLKFPNQLH